MEIEDVAARTPEKIVKESVDPAVGLRVFQVRRLAYAIGIPSELVNQAVRFMTGLYTAFIDKLHNMHATDVCATRMRRSPASFVTRPHRSLSTVRPPYSRHSRNSGLHFSPRHTILIG